MDQEIRLFGSLAIAVRLLLARPPMAIRKLVLDKLKLAKGTNRGFIGRGFICAVAPGFPKSSMAICQLNH